MVLCEKDSTMTMFQWVHQLGVWAQQHQTLFLWIVGGGMAVIRPP